MGGGQRGPGRVSSVVLPSVELASAVHHESYLLGPRDDPATEAWRTEIDWPIFRLAPR